MYFCSRKGHSIGSRIAKFVMSDRKPKLKELALALNSLSWGEVKSMAVQLGMEYFRLQQIEERSTKVSNSLLPAMDMCLNGYANATWTR